jgi:hypothetical protein
LKVVRDWVWFGRERKWGEREEVKDIGIWIELEGNENEWINVCCEEVWFES